MTKQMYLPNPIRKDRHKDIIAEQKIRDYANYSLALAAEHFARTHNCQYINTQKLYKTPTRMRKDRP